MWNLPLSGRSILLISVIAQSCCLNAQKATVEVRVTGEDNSIIPAKVVVNNVSGNNEKHNQTLLPSKNGVHEVSLPPGNYTIVACDGGDFEPDGKTWNWSPPNQPPTTVPLTLHRVPDKPETVPVSVRYGRKTLSVPVTITYKYKNCESTEIRATSDRQGNYMVKRAPQMEGLTYTAASTMPGRPLSAPPQSILLGSGKIVVLELDGPPDKEAGGSVPVTHTPSSAGGATGGYRTRVDTAISLEVNFAKRIFSTRRLQLNLEFPFVVRPSVSVTSDNHPSVARDYRALFFTPSAHLAFVVNRRVYPWVSLGSGLAYFVSGSINQQSLPFTARSTGKVALQSGAGVDFWPLSHLGFRTHIRNFYSGSPDLGVSGINLRNTLTVGSGFLIR